MLVKSCNDRVHIGKFYNNFSGGKTFRGWTTLCGRGYNVEEPLWEFLQVGSKAEREPNLWCHWCMERIKDRIQNEIHDMYVLMGYGYREAADGAARDIRDILWYSDKRSRRRNEGI